MKAKWIFLSLGLLMNALYGSTFSESEVCWVDCEKTYVSPEQLIFESDSIFVEMGSELLQLRSLHTDRQGYYFDSIMRSGTPGMSWECSNCGRMNEEVRVQGGAFLGKVK